MNKKILLFAIIALISFSCKSEDKKADSVEEIADVAVEAFIWDVEHVEQGSLMYLDVGYQRENTNSLEYLTLTVAKRNDKQRPEFISVIIPSDIEQTDGLLIAFANSVDKDDTQTMELQIEESIKVDFEKCTDEICTARIIDGFATRDNGEIDDLFQKFLTYDFVSFFFSSPDGSDDSVLVPLYSFKQQYESL